MNLRTRRRALMSQKSTIVYVHGTWEDLFRAIDAGTYATEYAVGETLSLDLGSFGNKTFKIVAMNKDALADNSGNAPVTLLATTALSGKHRMNPAAQGSSGNYTVGTGGVGGWEHSEMRSYLINSVLPAIPANVRQRIKATKRYSNSVNTAGTAVSNAMTSDSVWIPSRREVGDSNGETSGTVYLNSTTRTAISTAINATWYTRSATSYTSFRYVQSNGNLTAAAADTTRWIILGFCVG